VLNPLFFSFCCCCCCCCCFIYILPSSTSVQKSLYHLQYRTRKKSVSTRKKKFFLCVCNWWKYCTPQYPKIEFSTQRVMSDRTYQQIASSCGVFRCILTWVWFGYFMKGHKLKMWWYSKKGASRLEVWIHSTYDCDHVQKKGSPGSSVQPFETQAHSGLFGGESKWLVTLNTTLDKRCWVFSPSQEIADLFSFSWKVEEFVWVPDR
jgi:hypothetical protein